MDPSQCVFTPERELVHLAFDDDTALDLGLASALALRSMLSYLELSVRNRRSDSTELIPLFRSQLSRVHRLEFQPTWPVACVFAHTDVADFKPDIEGKLFERREQVLPDRPAIPLAPRLSAHAQCL